MSHTHIPACLIPHVYMSQYICRYQYCIEMLYNCSNKYPSRNYKKEYGTDSTQTCTRQ